MAEPFEIKIDTMDILRMSARYEGGPQIAREEIRAGMLRSVMAIEADAKREVPVDRGQLRRSLTHEVQDRGGEVTGRVGSNLPYADVVELGRRAGRPMPPVSAILSWMGRKGIGPDPDSGNTVEDLALLIARSIGRKGIKGRPYLKPAFEKNEGKIRRELGESTMRRVMERVGGASR